MVPPGRRSTRCATGCSPTPSSRPTRSSSRSWPPRDVDVSARIGIVQFPGTNCELDVAWSVEQLGGGPELLWHADADLRTGAIARFSPVMEAVARFAAAGGPVVGICNGFQVLTEADLLPGALQKNAGLSFLCETVECRVETARSPLTALATAGEVLRLPINHFEGNYVCDEPTRRRLRDDERIVLRYVRNPNGSLDDIAGICNEQRNVVGLMPHPERASDALLGSTDGVVLLRSLLSVASEGAAVA